MVSNVNASTAAATVRVGLWIDMRGPWAGMDQRDVTFCNPEEGMPSDERSHRESWGHLTRGQLGGGNVGPLPTWRLEVEHFQEMPTTCWGTRDRWNYPPEPSIKNYESVARLAGLPVRHTPLVGRANCHTRSRRFEEVSPEDLHLFWHPGGQMWGPPKPGLHCAPCSQMPYRGRFLPDDPSYQDVPYYWPLPMLPCLGTAIFGRGSQSAGIQWSLPFGDECSRIDAAHGEVHYL